MPLRKAGGNWVDGDRFFNREAELEALTERVHEGTHTLLTAQRRMGKTSLVRELLRRLSHEGAFETIFVDLEAAADPADAIAEVCVQSKTAQGAWRRIRFAFANFLPPELEVGAHSGALAGTEVRVKLRAGIDSGNWRQRGDEVFAALAANDRPVVLAIDEFPILANRLLKGHDYRVTPERRQALDEFLSWLRRNGQTHQGRITMFLSGSVSLEPVLHQAGLSAQANIFSPFELKPWDEQTAVACLGALAEAYEIDLPHAVRRDMCRRLRCHIPHHVQQFFDNLHEAMRRTGQRSASLADTERVYAVEMLGIRGQMDLEHYESRLRMVLGDVGYRIALEMLTEAAVNEGRLHNDAIKRYREYFGVPAQNRVENAADSTSDVLRLLEHDGYLVPSGRGYVFLSGLLEDWWRARHGQHFVPIEQRQI